MIPQVSATVTKSNFEIGLLDADGQLAAEGGK
jgi:hypothetical protein